MDSLASKYKEIGRVLSKKGTSNIFKYFAVDQPLSDVNLTSEEKDYAEVVYTAKTFFGLMEEPFDGFYYYASGGFEMLNLEGGLGSEESQKSMTFPSHLEAYSRSGQVNFWLGRENVTAYTHYDTSYNFHMVVEGEKRFLLFPPSAYSKLTLYPCLHTLYRQVSTDVLAKRDLKEFLRKMNGFEVVLRGGDVLYIPPYWFHTVVTVKTTLSLNIWSQSENFLVMEEVYKSAIPFESDWGRVKLMKTLVYFIQSLTKEVLTVYTGETCQDFFVRDHIYTRYEAVLKTKNPNEVDSAFSDLRKLVCEYCLKEPITELLEEKALRHLEEGASSLASRFLEIHPSAAREINLANYIEHLVWRILGTEDLLQLPVYLYECFGAGDVTT